MFLITVIRYIFKDAKKKSSTVMIAMHTIEQQCWKYTIARLSYSVTAYQMLLTYHNFYVLHLS